MRRKYKLTKAQADLVESLALAGYFGLKCNTKGLKQKIKVLRSLGWHINTEKHADGNVYVLYPAYRRAQVVKIPKPEPTYWWVYAIAGSLFLFILLMAIWQILT